MLTNIDINKMNHLLETNEDARQIITQLLKNHQEAVSLISHEIRNPLTLISSSLQIMELEHPEVKEFFNWKQTMDDVDFMCSLLNELSDYNNGNTLHLSVFSIEQLLKNIAVSFAISLESEQSVYPIEFTSRIMPDMGSFTGDKIKLEEVILNINIIPTTALAKKCRISPVIFFFIFPFLIFHDYSLLYFIPWNFFLCFEILLNSTFLFSTNFSYVFHIL